MAEAMTGATADSGSSSTMAAGSLAAGMQCQGPIFSSSLSDNSTDAADRILAAIILGQTPAAIAECSEGQVATLFDRACLHGIAGLAFDRLTAHGTATALLAGRFRKEALGRAMWELRHLQLLKRLVAELRDGGVEPICFKGTALAYSVYPTPHLRSRGDTDLLVSERSLAATRSILLSQGYRRQPALPSQGLHAEETWIWRGREGVGHAIDLHWRINNAHAIACQFTYDELRATARRIPEISGLLAVDPVTSVIIASFHRAVHRHDAYTLATGEQHKGERLCWLYDVHLLAETFGSADWRRVEDLARSKGLSGALQETLLLSWRWFASPIPQGLLIVRPTTSKADRYLRMGRVPRELVDIFGQGLGRASLRLLNVVFPPRDYLRWKYPEAQSRSTVSLHLRRWREGLAKRFPGPRVAP